MRDFVDVKTTAWGCPGLPGTPTVLSEESVALGQSLVSLNTVYRFRLGGHTTLSTTAGGIIDTYFPCDPSSTGTNFPEWSTLSALFSEFKLVEFGVQLTRGGYSVDGTSSGTFRNSSNPLMVAGNLGTAAAPGSYANLADNADAKLYPFMTDATATGHHHMISSADTRAQNIQWSQVTTPTVEPFAGAPGSIQVYSSGGGASIAGVCHVLVWGIYDFRSRV